MIEYQVIYWRDMPSQLTVRAGGRRGETVKKPLTERFEKAIDLAAMKGGAKSTDDYLAEWRKGEFQPYEGEGTDLTAIAAELADIWEKNYPASRLTALVAQAGFEKKEGL